MSRLKSLSIAQKLYIVCAGWIVLVVMIAAVGFDSASKLRSGASTHELLVVILAAWAVVVGGILTVLLARGLRRNAARALERMEKIRTLGADRLHGGIDALAKGDLTVTFPLVTQPITDFPSDELGSILREIEGASIAAFRASRLVWSASAVIVSTMPPIRCDLPASAWMVSVTACVDADTASIAPLASSAAAIPSRAISCA